jgi:hypothetical protein
MKYKIGDILCYEDTFENTIVDSVHFLITNVDYLLYYVMCFEDEIGPNEIYNINMIDSSPKWRKVS